MLSLLREKQYGNNPLSLYLKRVDILLFNDLYFCKAT